MHQEKPAFTEPSLHPQPNQRHTNLLFASGNSSCAVLLLLHARGLSKETSSSKSLQKQNLPYLGSPQHVQHVPICSVFVSHGDCQGREHRCCLCVLSHQAKGLSGACPPEAYPTITVLTAWLLQQTLHSLGGVQHSAFTTHSS